MTQPGTAREAAERNAQALMSGNLAQLMADLTPEALMQLMQVAAQQGGAGLLSNPAGAAAMADGLPRILNYEVLSELSDSAGEHFTVRFTSERGSATLGTTWQPVMGQWKVTGIRVVEVIRDERPAIPQPEPAGE